MQLFVGTSGYSYKEWKGSFYPEKLPQKDMLSHYCQQFATVELNNTFRRMPSESNFESWASQVPSTFQFAIKAPQTITHFKRLKGAEEPTAQLFQAIGALKSRLGPVLFGLPPNMKKDVARLGAFVRLIPRTVRAAFEFRHESWFDDEVFACLRRHRCALCVTDDEELPQAPFINATNWGYVRLRRQRYTKKSLANWIKNIRSMNWKETYVFFKHEDTGTGPRFASQFLQQARCQLQPPVHRNR